MQDEEGGGEVADILGGQVDHLHHVPRLKDSEHRPQRYNLDQKNSSDILL